jgi:hypothetical protein
VTNKYTEVNKQLSSKIIGWVTKHLSVCLIATVVVGLFFICTYWLWNWVILGAIATWILAAGVGVAILQLSDNRFRADKQAKEARNSTNAQIAVGLFEKLRNKETKNTLRYIYGLNRKLFKIIPEDEKHKIDDVMDEFELLGTLVNQEIVDDRLAIEAFAGPPALRCWYQLIHYIRYEDNKRGFYIINYEDFVRRTLDYFREKNMDVKFYQNGKKDIYLVKIFSRLLRMESNIRPRSIEEIRRAKNKILE